MEFRKENMFLGIQLDSKPEILKFISEQAYELGYASSSEELLKSFEEREEQFSTGLQDGFAIPHAKSEAALKVGIIYLKTVSPVEWESMDEQPIQDIFALIVPVEHAGADHLQVISQLATSLLEDDFKEEVKKLTTAEEAAQFLNQQMEVKV